MRLICQIFVVAIIALSITRSVKMHGTSQLIDVRETIAGAGIFIIPLIIGGFFS